MSTIEVQDPMLGTVEVDYNWNWDSSRTGDKYAVEIAEVGRCCLGRLSNEGKGISFDAFLYRYGRDVLGLSRDLNADAVVTLARKAMETLARVEINSKFGR